jgi:hypothetical protein
MKTLGHILIILAVTALITAALYFSINASGTGTNSDFPPQEQFQSGGKRPDFEGSRPERGEMGGDWMFGWIKNVGVIAMLVAIIVLPKRLFKRKRFAVIKEESDNSA